MGLGREREIRLLEARDRVTSQTVAMTDGASALVTILFTDLVGSTELLSRAGDEKAQRIFRAHHDLLARTAADHGGEEVKWLGDGLMVAFPSAAEALRAAVAMQQACRGPVHGERLAIRVGLNAGEAMRDAADWFGTPVVVARRLCDMADAGQIVCSELVVSLLEGRTEFTFSDLGALELKGVPKPVAALAVEYEEARPGGLAGTVPCVGRDGELSRLTVRLGESIAGRGGLVLVAGEPGIGKTRLVNELAARAERDGAVVLWGHCYEGEWTPPYAPFAEALDRYVASATPDELRADAGAAAAALSQLVPRLGDVLLSDLPEVVPLSPDEERFRLFDATAQFLVAAAARRPLLLCLDDVHWADKGSVGMLRHLARLAPRHRILIAGTYRDAEVDEGHPLADALMAFARETTLERLRLEGLDPVGTADLLSALGAEEFDERVGAFWARETAGNPFFIGELIRHLVEEGTLYRGPDGGWTTDRPLRELSLPDSVRDVVARRVARLAEASRRFVSVACAFEGPSRLDVVAAVAGLDEEAALDAVEEALAARVLEAAGPTDTYVFAHALIRHTLYDAVIPSRRVRLHRRVAEALESSHDTPPDAAQAGEIAVQWHRSRGLPGAERGVDPALLAADHAQARGGHDEAVRFLRLALDLLPDGDDRRPHLLGRLGIVLAWALDFDAAVLVAAEAGAAIAEAENKAAAVEYLADATYVCNVAGGAVQAWDLARQGLAYAGARDLAWALLVTFDYERQAAENADHPGVPLDTAERRESARILLEARLDPLGPAPMEAVFDSREEALHSSNLIVLALYAGEYARCAPLLEAEAGEAEALGRFARAARGWGNAAACQIALGRLDEAERTIGRVEGLAARLGGRVPQLFWVRDTRSMALEAGWEELTTAVEPLAASNNPALSWTLGALHAVAARAAAHLGRQEKALEHLAAVVPWLERAPGWTIGYPALAGHGAEVLWLLERFDYADVIERALREKVIAPDFRSPFSDARLSLARLCALSGHHDEALSWFAEARRVLTEQGALPLLAVCDFDEALMYLRRREAGDVDRARPLLAAARHQFEDIGMLGWIHRVDELRG
jgi:class 3 adenylate cyclase/tetratricopeptide (TPR) repeat protein